MLFRSLFAADNDEFAWLGRSQFHWLAFDLAAALEISLNVALDALAQVVAGVVYRMHGQSFDAIIWRLISFSVKSGEGEPNAAVRWCL